MGVKHHIADEFLMAYSAGNLPEAFNVVVAAHVSLSDDSRARLGAYETVGGAVLETVEPAALADDTLAATLARIKGSAPVDRSAAKRPAPGILPKPVQDYVGGDLNAVAWRKIGGGVKQAILPTHDDAKVRLLYIPSGMAMPDHSHGGTEMTLVLQGAYRDDDGEFHRGDIEVADEDVHHTPVAFGPMDCICLTATDARLRFTSILPRLAQPFLRI
ncbi:ChrR family anti-sigma-E factor [Meridianimarinicoccus aquatilis]|uniref:ChrR family anti-sigma-E factor n=1 Tax=Meridianimarinicoccus aquatilis TaxID=2552766 RepID=UPI001AA0706A|nr:ChrR family anti-sigma-E factor [Fluviibacterium aquatile]